MKRLTLLLPLLLGSCKSDVDFTQGRPYQCTDNSQCGTWVCGVLGTCIDPADAGNNACNTSADCFNGLRCNVEGICVDTTGQLLNLVAAAPGPVTILAPLLLPQGATNGEVAYAADALTGDPSIDSFRNWTFVASYEGQVSIVSSRASDYPFRTADGGQFSNVSQVAANQNFAWVMTDTNLFQIDTAGAAFGTTTPVHTSTGDPLGPDWDLRTSYFPNVALIAIAQDGGGDFRALHGVGAGVVRSGPFSTRSEIVGMNGCFLAVAPSVLSVANGVDGGWAQLALPGLANSFCGDGGTATPTRVRATTENLLAVAEDCSPPDPTVLDGNYGQSQSRVWLYDVSLLLGPGSNDDGGPPACVPVPETSINGFVHDTRVTPVVANCGACDLSNEELLDFFPLVLNQQYAIEATCIAGSTQHTYQVTQALDGSCTRTRVADPSPQFSSGLAPAFGGTNPFALSRGGAHGQLYRGDNLSTSTPLFLDQPPTGIFQPLQRYPDAGVPVRMFVGTREFEVTPFGIEQANIDSNTLIVSTVNGDSANVLLNDGVLVTLKDTLVYSFGYVVATPDVFIAPYGARQLVRSDGITEHIVRSFDSIYVGHYAGAPGNFPLKLALVPSGGTPISNLTVLANTDPDAGLLTGYALTPTGLFKIDENNDEVWSAVPVSTAPGNRISLFTTLGAQHRLGYDDGTLYALPSRVVIAAPLPDGAQAVDFQPGCSEIFVLSTQGLYRLVADPDGTGHWVNEPLDAGDDFNFSPSALSGGRLFYLSNTLFLFNAYGGALTFVPQGGCVQGGGM